MPSPITNIMGAAIAPLAQQSQTAQTVAKTQPGAVPQSQIVIASQAAAEKATSNVKPDKQRAVQFRKSRVEDPFTGKEVKDNGKGAPIDDEELSAQAEEPEPEKTDEAAEHKVDLVA